MKHPPYHLRANKAVDRFLLIDILRKIWGGSDLPKATYYGFGGPFLEDHRLLDQYFPSIGLVCIESNSHTHRRQRFHRCNKRVRLLQTDFSSFISSIYEPGDIDVFWLDYTDNKYLRIAEFAGLLTRVNPGSIVKITLRAESSDFPSEKSGCWLSEKAVSLLETSFIEEFTKEYDKALPARKIIPADFRDANFPALIQDILHVASQQALPASAGTQFQILHSCVYSDQTQMYSLTGVVANTSDIPNIIKRLSGWRFANTNWLPPIHIDVPVLSVKERLRLEALVPNKLSSGKALARSLGYNIDNGGGHSEEKLRQYADFCRYYPMFAKVGVC